MQDEGEIDTVWDDACSAAYKVGSILLWLNWSSQKIAKFNSTSHKIALHVNEMFGSDLLSGNEIHQCVKENRFGLSPPHQQESQMITSRCLLKLFGRVFLWIKPIAIQINSIDQNRNLY